MEKWMALLLALVLLLGCTACGGKTADENGNAAGGEYGGTGHVTGNEEENEPLAAEEDGEPDESDPDKEEDGPIVFDHFTSGTLVDEPNIGELFFSIDSIEKADDGIRIYYTLYKDGGGRRNAFRLERLAINGCGVKPEFYAENDPEKKKEFHFYQDTNVYILIPQAQLDLYHMTDDWNTLKFNFLAGYQTDAAEYMLYEREFRLFKGEAGELPVYDLQPEGKSVTVMDNEAGKIVLYDLEWSVDEDTGERVSQYFKVFCQARDGYVVAYSHYIKLGDETYELLNASAGEYGDTRADSEGRIYETVHWLAPSEVMEDDALLQNAEIQMNIGACKGDEDFSENVSVTADMTTTAIKRWG